MAFPSSSGIYFFPEDDVPPPGDPIHDLRVQQGQPPYAGALGVNDALRSANAPQRATRVYANYPPPMVRQQVFLPLVQVSHLSQILTTTARTTLTQIFYHPGNRPISKATYTFPLYANCSVVSFVCRIGESKVITGVVKPKELAKQTYESATSSGQIAGLLEHNTPDVFTTSIGNIPAGVRIKVEIGYILELPHDAEVDGIKFTVPLSIAPRYGQPPPGVFGQNGPEASVDKSLRMEIEVTMGEAIKYVGSPSHPTVVQLGQHGKGRGRANNRDHDPKKALVIMSQTPTELLKDFVLLITTITPHFISTPQALLETHPTISGHQALKVTLVPRFKMPRKEAPEKTEIIFLVDRSGSMRDTIRHVKSGLRVFLKSLPLGCFFNIISFGSKHTLLWERSRAYAEGTLKIASEHIETFDASYGGTELLPPLIQACSQRHPGLGVSTEIMVLTDGEIWRLPELLEYIQLIRKQSGGAIRLFSLGVGERVSHALIQGIAVSGGGYSQIVPSGAMGGDRLENGLEAKVVRMLNSALTDHIEEYKLHILHEEGDEEDSESDGEEEGVGPKGQKVPTHPAPAQHKPQEGPSRRINLFDPTAVPRQRSPTPPPSPDVTPASTADNGGEWGNRFAHLKKLQGPEVMQAPFDIPPLFPYERSVVYLLIPPTTRQLKYAKSVTLSATTTTGDKLSLSIPITHIEQPGVTLHQLAARMLLRDLEEGKSWLHSGKYGVLAGDSAGIQGHVQREGEDVGVRWSLASKWTSFVGIEEEILNKGSIQTPAPPEEEPSGLPKGGLSAPGAPSGPLETSVDGEGSMPIDKSASHPGLYRTPLSKPSPTYPLLKATGSRAPRSVFIEARAINSGADSMSRLLAPRDTPDPTHPVWNRPPPHFVRDAQGRNCLPSQLELTQASQVTGSPGGSDLELASRLPLKSARRPQQPQQQWGLPPAPELPCRGQGPPPATAPAPFQPKRIPTQPPQSFSPAFPPENPPESISPPVFSEPPRSIPPPAELGSSDAGQISPAPTSPSVKGSEGDEPKGFLTFSLDYILALPQVPVGYPVDIYRIIAAQKPDGSFPIEDVYVVELLGSRIDSVHEACGGDKVAWVAFLIAALLEIKYRNLRYIWELVVRRVWVFLSGREVKAEALLYVVNGLAAG